jgi:colicin import membrane protein
MSPIETITRGALDVWAHAARLPLRAAERIVRPEDPETWGPAIALEQAEAGVRGTIGGLLGDVRLQESARLQRRRVTQLQEAVRKQAQAEALEQRASEQLHEATQEVAEDRAESRRKAAQATVAAERRERAKKQQAAAEAAQRKQAVAKAEQAHDERLAQKQAAADQKRLAKEQRALEQKRAALVAEEEALRLDDAAEKVKERRKPTI